MEVISITKDYKAANPCTIALGNFDGVHLAHKKLIESAIKMAKKKNVKAAVLIFSNHTKTVLDSKRQELITTNKYKDKILEDLGIDIVYEIVFDSDFMKLTPQEFFEDFLIKNLNVKGIVVGFDYRFGYKASGNVESLKSFCQKEGIDLEVIAPVYSNGEIIGSTMIREAIKAGRMIRVEELLGRPFTIFGKVVEGKHLASKMHYPTANIDFSEDYVVPRYGVYDTDVVIDGKIYRGATSVGTNPTTKDRQLKIETHILDFSEKIYGKVIALKFRNFIRPEINFESIEKLFDQIEKDVQTVRNR
ncbi:bifunctional riboflavin kinase/FAD synthetase [Peptoniphilus sp. GNH]|nr:riboflavin biosynthesis protein RibF [Clostridiales bacterium KA00134]UHR02924.1 bifunctional riboflavin kinase/FAD synthetase [Peptoniphilus sp. GNH]